MTLLRPSSRWLLSAGALLACGSAPSAAAMPVGAMGPPPALDVKAAGATGNGITNDSPFLQKLVDAHPSANLYFPPGRYLLHNRGRDQAGLKLEGFSGSIRMAKGAAFLCDTATADAGQCIWIIRSNGPSFKNVTITYFAAQSLPLLRSAATGNALLVESSRDVSFWNTTVLGSTGSGIWNTNSVRIRYHGLTAISRTTADGLHFENVADASVSHLVTDETGDDALAATNVAQTHPNCGLVANRIHIHNSHSRGIATAGACVAEFSDIVIRGTANSALAATQDAAIGSRPSSAIKFSHAVLEEVGKVKGIPGNGYCIDVAASSDISISDVSCTDARGDGVLVYHHARDVVVKNVTVSGAGNNGFQSAAGSSYVYFLHDHSTGSVRNGFDIEGSGHVILRECRSDGAGGYGFYHSSSWDVAESGLVSRNSAGRRGDHRAWWAEDMAGPLTADAISIIDDQPSATGYIVGDDGDGIFRVTVTNLKWQIANGAPSIQRGGSTSNFSVAGQPEPAR